MNDLYRVCARKLKGNEANAMTCNIFIDGLCNKDQIGKILDFLFVLVSKWLEVNVVICSTLIIGLCKGMIFRRHLIF
jgi:pentatricopeptide repeat protein